MRKTFRTPCAAWAEKLAARYPDDLSAAEAVALQEHLKRCEACSAIHATYALLEAALRRLPPVEPVLRLPGELQEAWTEKKEQGVHDQAGGGLVQQKKTERVQQFPVRRKGRRNAGQQAHFPQLVSMIAAVLVVIVFTFASALVFRHHTIVGSSHAMWSTTSAPTSRVINVHQTVTVKGIHVTLERVVVAPSETRLYVRGGAFLTRDEVTLSVGEHFYLWWGELGAQAISVGMIGTYTASSGLLLLSVDTGLVDQHGMWTLQVIDPSGNTGTWTFHVVVT